MGRINGDRDFTLRWPDWIGSVYAGGQDDLTAKLVSLLAADLASHAVRFKRPASMPKGV